MFVNRLAKRVFSTSPTPISTSASTWKNCGDCRFYKERVCKLNDKPAIQNRMDVNYCGSSAKYFHELDKTNLIKAEETQKNIGRIMNGYFITVMGVCVFVPMYLPETIMFGVPMLVTIVSLDIKRDEHMKQYEKDNSV